MNSKKFFSLAKEKGIADVELNSVKSKSISIQVFNGSLEKFKIANSTSIKARGILNDKFGFASTNIDDKLTADFLVNEILQTAKYIEKEEKAILFKGSPKYKNRKTFNPELSKTSSEAKIKMLFELEQKIRALDSRITDVEIGYSEAESERKLCNSFGLNLKNHSNYGYIYGEVVARKDDQVKSGFDVKLFQDLSEINLDELAKKVVSECVDKFDGTQCDSKSYPVLLRKDIAATLVSYAIASTSAEEVQKGSSIFAGKLHEKIASSKLTVSQRPLDNTLFFSNFDDEGVATKNMDIIKKGVLQTYLYNLETAAKDGVESTGNASAAGANMEVAPNYLVIKPGKKSFDELLKEADNGVYITSLAGLHAGLNPRNGDFSLQAEGFMIENGKITKPLYLITLGGNLFKLFRDIREVGADAEILPDGISSPSILIKKLNVSGK